MLSKLRKAVRKALSPRFNPVIQVPIDYAYHGTAYGGWAVHPQGLSPQSVVYAFGVGEDISFDLAIIESYGVQVHAFDPTPRSIAWVKAQTLPPQFHLYEYGLEGYDGMAKFYPPSDTAHISHTALNQAQAAQPDTIEVPMQRLSSIMQQLGHSHIDLLKMDIEGSEYAVIDDILRTGLKISQLLVEFHPHMMPQGIAKTKSALAQLNAAGYKIFYISENRMEYSLIHHGGQQA